MASYEHALAKQEAKKLMEALVDQAVEQVIDNLLEARNGYLDPFNRLRLKQRLLKGMAEYSDRQVERVASEAVRRSYG